MKDKANFDTMRPGQARDGAVYYVGPGANVLKPDLVKIEFPGVRKSLLTDVPRGWWSVLVNDELYVVGGKDWWHGSVEKNQLRHLGTFADGELDHVGLSSHYGVMVLFQRQLHQVVVTPKEPIR